MRDVLSKVAPVTVLKDTRVGDRSYIARSFPGYCLLPRIRSACLLVLNKSLLGFQCLFEVVTFDEV
jgi:hypothetical protein